jgi:hypothetical protein
LEVNLVRHLGKYFAGAFSLLLVGCLFDSAPPDPISPGANGGDYRLFPNDLGKADSAAKYFAQGVILPGHPGASYSLSFVAGEGSIPNLRLYRLIPKGDQYMYTTDQLIEGKLSEGQWRYDFNANFSSQIDWLTILEQKGKRYETPLTNLHFAGWGSNSSHISLNLWITGKYVPPAGGETPQELAKLILAGYRTAYGPAGITVDTVYLQYASSHRLSGKSFPDSLPIVAEDIESRFDSLGNGLAHPYSEALDLVLIFGFQEEGMLGLSPLFGKNLEAGEAGVVLLSTHRSSAGLQDFTAVGSEVMVATAVHETGHFFGLRHTTVTQRDMMASGDFSAEEDGIGDTPWCPGLAYLVGTRDIPVSSKFLSRKFIAGLAAYQCPDAENPMFPYSTDVIMGAFTEGQGAILAKNLSIFPH